MANGGLPGAGPQTPAPTGGQASAVAQLTPEQGEIVKIVISDPVIMSALMEILAGGGPGAAAGRIGAPSAAGPGGVPGGGGPQPAAPNLFG